MYKRQLLSSDIDMKKILIFLMSAAVAVSCSDDIFDVDPSGKVSSETRDEVAKEDPDKVLQGIEARCV